MLVNSCYMFHEVWELERFQTANVIQGHSRTLTMVPLDRPHMISHVSILHCFRDIINYFPKFKEVT